jgi:transposase
MDLQAVDTVLVDSLWRVVQIIFAGADDKGRRAFQKRSREAIVCDIVADRRIQYQVHRSASDTTLTESTYVSWAKNCSIPVAHHYIVAIHKTVRTTAISYAFLSFLQLFQEAKVAGNYRRSVNFDYYNPL